MFYDKVIICLRKLYDGCKLYFWGFKVFGVDENIYFLVVVFVVLNKLFEVFRLIIIWEIDFLNWNMEEMFGVFFKELEFKENYDYVIFVSVGCLKM